MKIGFIGNLAGGAIMMERPVAKMGHKTCVLIPRNAVGLEKPENSDYDVTGLEILPYGVKHQPKAIFGRIFARILHELSCFVCLIKLRRFDLIQSFTGSLYDSSVWRYAFGRLRYKPYIACATGSDIRESAASDEGRSGHNMRRFFREAEIVLLLNIDMVRVAQNLGLTNARFFPFSVRTELFKPDPSHTKTETLRIFMPSNLDWGHADSNKSRNSTKGNDRLIRAFSRLIKQGHKAELVLLKRGPDVEAAQSLIKELGIQAMVTFKGHLNKAELVRQMQMADIIADQFDIGSFGTTGLEAMSVAKPVLIKIDIECAKRCYEELPPVKNVETEDEIFNALEELLSEEKREYLGRAAREWILKNHDSQVVGEKLSSIYQEIKEK